MSDPIPALTLYELGLCIVVHDLTRYQLEGAPDGNDYVPDLATIIAWLDTHVPTLSDDQREDIAPALETLFDAGIIEKDDVYGVTQFHLTGHGHYLMLNGARTHARSVQLSNIYRAPEPSRDAGREDR